MYQSETSKHRHQILQYCRGNGIDVGSAGAPVTPTVLQIDLERPYCPSLDDPTKNPPVQFKFKDKNCYELYWFKDNVLDYCYSSHLIEDFTHAQQEIVIKEWARVVKPGGYLIILAPENGRWKAALAAGQPPNLAHKNEPRIGELTDIANKLGNLKVLEDRFADDIDYGLIFVAQKQ